MSDLFIMFGLAMIGQVAHWFKRASRHQTMSGYFKYMRHNPYSTVRALSGIGIIVTGLIASGVVLGDMQSYASVVLAGYSIDSLVNEFPEDTGNGI
jgi:uncharacterized membrane protein YjgN (DUF898 family)